MADQLNAARTRDENDENDEKVDGDGAPAKPARKWRLSGRRMIYAAAGGVLVLGIGAYAAAAHFGLIKEEPQPEVVKPALFYDLPEMVVNLSATEPRAQYLKIKVALEVASPEVMKMLEPVMPRVLDLFQLYLRELRASDLDGSAGIFRLKEELLRRVNLELHPAKVDRVLFKEIIVQ